jgi:hypothetical protein
MLDLLFSNFAAACASSKFFGIPPWYQYLNPQTDALGNCVVDFHLVDPASRNLQLDSILLLGFGILDILLRVAALVAVGYIIYASLQYVTAQGEPDKAKKALGTIINALIGLGITIIAAAAVSFIGHRFGS